MVNEIDRMYSDLAKIADNMESQSKLSDARMLYEALSGAIVWSDELPACNFECMRFVFNYRTGLLINKPNRSYELFWQEARRRFPNWIGFSEDRVSFRSDALAFYNESRLKEFGPQVM